MIGFQTGRKLSQLLPFGRQAVGFTYNRSLQHTPLQR